MSSILHTTITIKSRKDYESILVNFTEKEIQEWCLLLTLLEKKLIDSIKITNKQLLISLYLLPKTASIYGQYFEFNLNNIRVFIGQNDIDYWLSFFLKAYRDGMGDVDHIDFDISPSGEKKGLFLTLHIPKSKPPLTPNELKKLLES